MQLAGRVVFPYITIAENTFPVVPAIVLTGPCDGQGPCSMTPTFFGPAFEGQPASFALVPAHGGYTLSTRFDHVDARVTCSVSVRLELTVTIVTSTPDLRIIGSGQYTPDQRSALGADGVRGCFTDVAVFSFASVTLPAPAPPPPN